MVKLFGQQENSNMRLRRKRITYDRHYRQTADPCLLRIDDIHRIQHRHSPYLAEATLSRTNKCCLSTSDLRRTNLILQNTC